MDQTAPVTETDEVTTSRPYNGFTVPSHEVMERLLDGLHNLPAHPATSKG